jgi:LacI family transcriptional regulator
MRSLDYRPSRAAQQLRARKSLLLGLIISDIQNPFFTSMVRGIEDEALASGYSLLLCNSDENSGKERRYLDVMREERVAGVIVASTRRNNPDIATLVDNNIAVVGIDRTVNRPVIDMVTTDNVYGTRTAIEHLLALGHTRIGFIGLPANVVTGVERRRGYLDAMRNAGLTPEPAWLTSGDTRQSGGYAGMLALLDIKPALTAVFGSSNLTTMGALNALHDRGLSIPSDMSVAGFDDLPWNLLVTPAMTAVSQPTYAIGQRAAQTLLQRIENPDAPPQRITLSPELIVRASTSRPPGPGTRARP